MKTKKLTALLVTAMTLGGATTVLHAEDFSRYSDQQLEQLQVREMNEAERNAYRNEVNARNALAHEKERLRERNRVNESSGQGELTRQRSTDGSQTGGQYGRSSAGSGNAANGSAGGGRGK